MKKLFGCVCVCQVLLPVLLLLCTIAGVKANNIRVEGKTRVVSIVNDTAVIEVTLRWDNSWRDDFNWDAAWVFFKFKKRGLENPWQHAYLSSSGHVLSNAAGNEGGGYAYMVGANAGKVNGLYVMRNGISEGNVSVRLQAKWPLNGTGLTKSDFGNALNEIYVAVHAIEMVYIPYNSYYLGDGASNNMLISNQEIANQGYCTTSSIYNGYPASNAISGNSSYWCSAGTGNEEWWQIKLATPCTITSFALGVYASVQYGYLEGSNTGLSGDWKTLWSGGNNCFPVTSSYPFSTYLTVVSPGSYTYYRIRMKSSSYSGIYNISLKSQGSPILINSENILMLGIKGDNNLVSLSASYPKGYAGFYVMKYETSQEQYVEFLNSLTLDQQKARVANNNFSTMKRGDYVFGDITQPSNRNGIVFVEQRTPIAPVVFGNNLNPNNDLFSTDDGQTLACNYMSIEDMIAYCSWSGLRPMSELEYEKACRRPYPQLPEAGEYAWNSNTGVNSLNGLRDLAYLGDEREVANNASRNVNGGTNNRLSGPVRCGMFATSSTSQLQSGGTYWGVMDMSGNLKELCVSVGNPNFNGSSCGTGVYNPAYWNTAVGSYGVRGGGFSSPDSLLRTSDRTEAMDYFTTITQRDSTVGFRGVYSLSGIKIDGGKIKSDTVCSGGEKNILNLQSAFCADLPNVRFQYTWYVKKPGETVYELVENAIGESLQYEVENTTPSTVVYHFKRVGECAMGIAECETSLYILPVPWTESLETYANVYPSFTVTSNWGGMSQTHWKLENPPAGISIAANSGLVSGLDANSIFKVDVTVSSDRCPGQEWRKTLEVIRQFKYTGAAQSITLKADKYKIECWGAGAYNSSGGYTAGEIAFNTTTTLAVYVGQRLGSGNGTSFNGGTGSSGGWPGGGASDIRLVLNANWKDFASLKSRIMVAAGGGAASGYGGAGGGLVGYSGGVTTGGSQTTCGSRQSTGYLSAGFGYGGGGCGGGGGYYGGGAAACANGAGGGSSFISGHNGCNAISASSTASNIIHTGQPNHYSGFYFTNTVMIDGAGYQWTTQKGTYVGMPNLTETGMMIGNSGNGQVNIRPLP